MELIPDWKKVLLRSATVWFSAASNFMFVMAGAVYVFADDLGDWSYFYLAGGLGLVGVGLVSVIPLVRIIKQPGLHAD
jgi:hypothetical protein